jgi:predicted dehydrogenase
MDSRRDFLKAAAVAAVGTQRVLGANEKVRMGVIGVGTRGTMVNRMFRSHADCEFVAACDVRKSRVDAAIKAIGGTVDGYSDYRRILERKDIDAVLVTTPDHWHSPVLVDACAAGKDVYVEKPISNTLPAAMRMVEAARKYNRVVAVGIQQRVGQHFLEAGKLIQDGVLGAVTHCVLLQPGGYTQITQPAEAPPADLDWEMFQGAAPRKPYSPSRLGWRSYYDYGGGLITDWGVHLTDIALLYMKADSKGPLLTSASAQYVRFPKDLEQVPDAFVCSWQYDNFVMSFTNVVPPNPAYSMQGNWFYGERGVLHVNRSGYRVIPGGRGAGRGGPQTPAIEAKTVAVQENYQDDPDTKANARNFLDCVKSRKRPATDVAIGFNSTLPCLIALQAVLQGKTLAWDGKTARAV